MATGTVVRLEDLRDLAALALNPVEDTDPVVLVDFVDSLVPPALMIGWADPWLEAGAGRPTMGPCVWQARLRIICIAGRLEPGPGYDTLDTLVTYVLTRMRADTYPWALDRVGAPQQYDLSGVPYLAAFAEYTTPTTI